MTKRRRRGYSWPVRRGDKRHTRPQERDKLSIILDKAEERIRAALAKRVRWLSAEEVQRYEAEILARPPRVHR